MTSITFLGAARTVTGSKYLVDTGSAKVLVDAGLFQGLKELRRRNWEALPLPPKEIDAIVLTHAHLDHVGYLPRLVAQGFRGRVFCTAGTKDLCGIVLPDAGRIQEEDARQANTHGYTKHSPALPLYTEDDAINALTLLQPVGYDRPVPVADGMEVDFINAGHLLGSAYARMKVGGTTILFGGDLGRFDRPVLPDPTLVAHADYLLVESTYGDRTHPKDDNGEVIATVIRETIERGGRIIIPSFAIGRVEEVLWWIGRLESEQRIPIVPVYLDSPMASAALQRYSERVTELDPDLHPEEKDDLTPHGVAAHEPADRRRRQAQHERELCGFCTARFRAVSGVQESKVLTRSTAPCIVISSSGMATGGRVLHHLKAALPDTRNTVLLVGFQAEGTRGRRLRNGEKTVRIHGVDVPVNARVASVDSMSAHADSTEIMRWLRGFESPPKRTFLVHGEPAAMQALDGAIRQGLGWTVYMPGWQERVDLDR